MGRTWVWCVVPLLLLATGPAWAGEEDAGAEAERAEIAAHAEKLHRAARDTMEMLERGLGEARHERERLRAEGTEGDVQALGARIDQLERWQVADREVIGLLEECKARLANGRVDAAREAMKQAARRLEEIQRAMKGGAPGGKPVPPEGMPPERVRETIEHLLAAAGHLRAVGAVKEAEALEAKASEMRAQREKPPLPLEEQVRQLRREVEDLRREIRELRERLQR